MFDALKNMGQLAGLMRNLPKIQEEMQQLQERLGQITAEGDAGAGMVKVRCNGKFEITGCTLSAEAMAFDDREMLEDLIRAATNQALSKARQLAAEETGKMAASLGLPSLPPGLGFPG